LRRITPATCRWISHVRVHVAARCANDHFTSRFREGTMADKNRKKTYLILIAILIVVLLITYL